MTIESSAVRKLGTMVAYGFADLNFDAELALAERLGAQTLEIFPDWRSLPDAVWLRTRVSDAGLSINSAHGCWGGQSIRAARVDLGHPDPATQAASLADLKACVSWLHEAGGAFLVIHPGGLSDPVDREARQSTLAEGLIALAEHARGSGVVVCVENMPPGVHPGSRMADLYELVAELGHPLIGLALDTGHANITQGVGPETLAAGALLRTTHVHDNDGRQDTHLPPGWGTVDWQVWGEALAAIDYRGAVMLECVRQFRKYPDAIDGRLRGILASLTGERTGDAAV